MEETLLLDEPISADEPVDLDIATEAGPTPNFVDHVSEVASTLIDGLTKAFDATK